MKNNFNTIEYDPNISTFKVDTHILSANEPSNGHPMLLASLPLTTILHDIDSKFLKAYFVFDLRDVPLKLRKYLMLFDSLLSKSPAFVDGELLSDVDVSNLMIKELMELISSPGFLGSYRHFYTFYVVVGSFN